MENWKFAFRDEEIQDAKFEGKLSEVIEYANKLFNKLENVVSDGDWAEQFDEADIWSLEYSFNALKAMIGGTVFQDNFGLLTGENYFGGESLQYYFAQKGGTFKNYNYIDVTRTIICLAEEFKIPENEFKNAAGMTVAEAKRILEK